MTSSQDPRFTGQQDQASGFQDAVRPLRADDGGRRTHRRPRGPEQEGRRADSPTPTRACWKVWRAWRPWRSPTPGWSAASGIFISNTIEILISAIESRDLRMAGHCWRFAQRATSLGRKLGLEGQALEGPVLLGSPARRRVPEGGRRMEHVADPGHGISAYGADPSGHRRRDDQGDRHP